MLHRVLWESPNPPGREFCEVRGSRRGWTLRGTVLRRLKEGTEGVNYRILADPGWSTTKVEVRQLLDGEFSSVDIEADGGGWRVGGKERPDLEGCVDVDLEVSPVTNTLPIRRAKVKQGSRVDVEVAWVRFPSLEVRRLSQSYTRVGKDRYVYRSSTGFEAELTLDGFGLVRTYGDYWAAV
jgi:hypothetical protein